MRHKEFVSVSHYKMLCRVTTGDPDAILACVDQLKDALFLPFGIILF